jgi:hypothetical protein
MFLDEEDIGVRKKGFACGKVREKVNFIKAMWFTRLNSAKPPKKHHPE